ncbi:MAG: hypothetical protein VX130_03900 [Verrucomicrobiota bacterium]|nr:hypothetical protein [Verrucomicrobiota bacterium]
MIHFTKYLENCRLSQIEESNELESDKEANIIPFALESELVPCTNERIGKLVDRLMAMPEPEPDSTMSLPIQDSEELTDIVLEKIASRVLSSGN